MVGSHSTATVKPTTEAYLEPHQITVMERFCKNGYQLNLLSHFEEKASSNILEDASAQDLERITPLSLILTIRVN